jgi:hypothetical protein
LSIHDHKFTFKHLCWHSITKILRNGPRAHFPFSYEFYVRVMVVFQYFMDRASDRVLGADKYNVLFSWSTNCFVVRV